MVQLDHSPAARRDGLLVKRLDVVRRFFLFRFGIVHRTRLPAPAP
jgi:hypothetical protein